MNSKKHHSCIILCGGQSRRMGQDKGSMIIQDKPMINHVLSTLNNEINEVIIVLNNKDRIDKYKNFIKKEDYNFTVTFVEDEIKNITINAPAHTPKVLYIFILTLASFKAS